MLTERHRGRVQLGLFRYRSSTETDHWRLAQARHSATHLSRLYCMFTGIETWLAVSDIPGAYTKQVNVFQNSGTADPADAVAVPPGSEGLCG